MIELDDDAIFHRSNTLKRMGWRNSGDLISYSSSVICATMGNQKIGNSCSWSPIKKYRPNNHKTEPALPIRRQS